MKRKLTSLLLVLAMVFALLPASVFAADTEKPEYQGFQYTATNDGIELLTYQDKDATELTIPAEIDGKPVIACTEGFFKGMNQLKKVTFPEGFQSIYTSAFEDCTALEEIVVPDSLCDFGAGAFYGCTSLKSIKINAGGKRNWLLSDVFSGCTSLENVEIEDGLGRIFSRAFQNCTSLKEIYIPASVYMIDQSAFEGCTNLTIHGVVGSTAQRFAEAMDIPFVAEEYPGSFDDVDGGRFYGVPVLWAAENGITTGYTDNTFRPNRTCTRAEMVTFLWRLEYCPEPNSMETKFTDLRKNSFYEKAVLWAAENGIVNGVSETKFCPNAPVKRSEVVALLYRLDKEPKYDTSAGSAFKDVDPEKDSGRFYYDAMCWATQNDIVKGYPDNTFQPNAYCKRGEIVTFLYRNLGPYLAKYDDYIS